MTEIVVAGWLAVDPAAREAYLAGCVDVVRRARAAPGCLDFALAADLVDPARVVVLERWADRAALEAFRGSGPEEDQAAAVRDADVRELVVHPGPLRRAGDRGPYD